MKKALTLLLTLCLIVSVCSLPVSAVSIPFNSTNIEIIDAAQGTIKVSGEIKNDTDPILENRYVTIMVLPFGTAPTEYHEEVAMITVTAGTDGKFSKVFTFTGIGNFSFYVSYEDYISNRADVEIKGIASAAEVVKSIHNGSIPQGGIASAIATHGQIGVDLTRFPVGFDRDLFEYRIYTNRAEIDVTGTDIQILESFYALIDRAEDEVAFVKEFNAVTYATKYITLMRENADCIKGISFADYDALSDSGKITVQNSFLGKTYKNADEIKDAFDNAVAKAKKNESSPGGGNGGGAGGGGGGGGAPAKSDREWGTEMEDNSANTPEQPKEEPVKVTFTDIADVEWAKDAIEALAGKGIIAGKGEGIFDPNGLVTREQFAKMLVLAAEKYDESAVNEFTDIPEGDWSAAYVASAKAAGFVNGIGEGKFGYGESITREDMAVMIYNVMKSMGVDFSEVKDSFADYDQISDYAKEAVGALTAKGIINGVGDNMFAPKDTATRAQAALLVYAIVKGVA